MIRRFATIGRRLGFLSLAAALWLSNVYGAPFTDPYRGEECASLLDQADMVRDWGTRLLAEDDPAFSDPEYVAEILAAIRPGAVGMDPRWRGKYDKAIDRFEMMMMSSQSATAIRFAHSGTDANNALYEFAEYAFRKRTGKSARRVNLLYFQDPYAGVHGRVAEISVRYDKDPRIAKNFQIPTPFVQTWGEIHGAELASIEAQETAALEFIARQVANPRLEIGGIFIEPIAAANGVRFYRPEFMRKLRVLADEINVPIFADEVLTGGGRTGKFWAYEHYPDFEPDLITFGKGMGVSGVAQIIRNDRAKQTLWSNGRRWSWESSGRGLGGQIYDNTSRAHPLALIQSGQILRRIHSGQMVAHAKETGRYFVERLQAKAKKVGLPFAQIRGVGMLIDMGDELAPLPVQAKIFARKITAYKGRLTPVLNLSREQIDELIPL